MTKKMLMTGMMLAGLAAAGQARRMVFLDVTASLPQGQFEAGLQMAWEATLSAPANSRVEVYTISNGGQAPLPLLEGTVAGDRYTHPRQMRAWRAQLWRAAAAAREGTLRGGRSQTCILNVLEFAGRRLAAEQKGGAGTEIVIVSDLQEDCADTPLEQAVRLDARGARQAVTAAGRLPENRIQLGGTELTFAVPRQAEPAAAGPRLSDLEAFWRAVAARCGGAAGTPPHVRIAPSLLPDDLRPRARQ